MTWYSPRTWEEIGVTHRIARTRAKMFADGVQW